MSPRTVAVSRLGMPLTGLVIAGGRGLRLWPESRSGRPKPLFSPDGRTTLLSLTITRVQPLIARRHLFILCSADQAPLFARATAGLVPKENLLVEPEGRGTAVAIAYGCAVIRRRVGAALTAVMPADHLIAPASGLRRTLARAFSLAASDERIAVVGVAPARAEPGFGYQEIGPAVGAGFRVRRFIEKPPLALARRMVACGRFWWNAGIFVMSTATLESELSRHAPALAALTVRMAQAGPRRLARLYASLRYDSFDRVVVEKSSRVVAVKADFRWHDVGSWQGLWEALKGSRTNALSPNAFAIDCEGVMARASRRPMVLLGVKDLVAVDAGEILFITTRARSQELKRLGPELGRRGLGRYL